MSDAQEFVDRQENRSDVLTATDGACQTMAPPSDCTTPQIAANCDGGWCFIPKGCFIMGSPECEWGRGRDSEGENQTTLTHDFWMKQTELTQGEWVDAGFANPSGTMASGQGDCKGADCPVGNMTFYEMLSFANALSASRGLPSCYDLMGCAADDAGLVCADAGSTGSLYECAGYRLPTEAEWEYAARAGTRTAFFSGPITPAGSAFAVTECAGEPALEDVAWYCNNTNSKFTHPVGGKAPNAWGLLDILGNAAEAVNDSFGDGWGYGSTPRVNPGASLAPGSSFVLRGGAAWLWPAAHRAANRMAPNPRWGRGPGVGFRLVRRAD